MANHGRPLAVKRSRSFEIGARANPPDETESITILTGGTQSETTAPRTPDLFLIALYASYYSVCDVFRRVLDRIIAES